MDEANSDSEREKENRFTNSVFYDWNKPGRRVADGDTIESFKLRRNRFMDGLGMWNKSLRSYYVLAICALVISSLSSGYVCGF